MASVSPAFGLAAVEYLGLATLSSIFSTSPRRAILWQAQDATGNAVVDANGQPVQSTLYPQVVVEERHYDEVVLTDHPVEYGAAITDHAFKLPSVVEIRAGWSFGSSGNPSPIPVATDPSYLKSLYATLLQIQAQRSFVSLVTGKRNYSNMLLRRLAVRTDEKTENVLSIHAEFKQVLIAYTQTVSVPDASVMLNPQSNAASTNLGQTSLTMGNKINTAAANAVLRKSLQLP